MFTFFSYFNVSFKHFPAALCEALGADICRRPPLVLESLARTAVYLKSNTHSHAHIHTQIRIRRVPLYYLQVLFPFHRHYERRMLRGKEKRRRRLRREKSHPELWMEGFVKAGNGGYSEVLPLEIEKWGGGGSR